QPTVPLSVGAVSDEVVAALSEPPSSVPRPTKFDCAGVWAPAHAAVSAVMTVLSAINGRRRYVIRASTDLCSRARTTEQNSANQDTCVSSWPLDRQKNGFPSTEIRRRCTLA